MRSRARARARSRRPAALVLAAALLVTLALPASAARPQPPGPATISWSGYDWTVKDHSRKIGPGPNFFSAANVSVDAGGNLHLRIQRSGKKWTAAEVILQGSFGYGTYSWTVASAPDLDPNVVLGMFTWNDAPDYAHREIDIEFARWGSASDPNNAQYVVQPWDLPGHEHRWRQAPGQVSTTHRFTWRPGAVDFVSLSSSGEVLQQHTMTDGVPVPGGENARINLWLFRGSAPTNGQNVEIVLSDFTYTAP
jgi:hypothetical protein